MSNFLVYSVLNRIENNDFRKVAAFQLHLDGPAQSWFVCLDNNTKNTWESLSVAFKDKYLKNFPGRKYIKLHFKPRRTYYLNQTLLPFLVTIYSSTSQ